MRQDESHSDGDESYLNLHDGKGIMASQSDHHHHEASVDARR